MTWYTVLDWIVLVHLPFPSSYSVYELCDVQKWRLNCCNVKFMKVNDAERERERNRLVWEATATTAASAAEMTTTAHAQYLDTGIQYILYTYKNLSWFRLNQLFKKKKIMVILLSYIKIVIFFSKWIKKAHFRVIQPKTVQYLFSIDPLVFF